MSNLTTHETILGVLDWYYDGNTDYTVDEIVNILRQLNAPAWLITEFIIEENPWASAFSETIRRQS